jgi:hypothetical protein
METTRGGPWAKAGWRGVGLHETVPLDELGCVTDVEAPGRSSSRVSKV